MGEEKSGLEEIKETPSAEKNIIDTNKFFFQPKLRLFNNH
jgi:hypothetical protein